MSRGRGPLAGVFWPDSDGARLQRGGSQQAHALAASGTQLLVSGPELGFQLTEANLASDVDVIAVHQEYYGVPWTEFGAGPPTHPPSGRKMSALAASARNAGKQVFLWSAR